MHAPFRPRTVAAHLMAIAVIALGCGDDKSTGPAATGVLAVTVTNASAAPAAVHVRGPAGFAQTVSATTVLFGVPVGTYTVRADSLVADDSVVGTALLSATVTNAAPTVIQHDTTQTSVSYSLKEQRGALWIADIRAAQVMEAIGADQLRTNRTLTPVVTEANPEPDGVAFDAAGVMWVSGIDQSAIRRYTIAERSTTGPVTSGLTLNVSNLSIPEQMVFDANGTLWVANYTTGLIGITAAQLSSGQTTITGAYAIQDTSLDPLYQGMHSIALDAAGNAWISRSGMSDIIEFTHDQLASSGRKTPAIRISESAGAPVAIAFDAHGNLWVANEDYSTVVMFTPAQLAASGAPVPTVSLVSTNPGGLAFDRGGSLWVTNKYGLKIYKYRPSQLTVSGTPTPELTLSQDPTSSYLTILGVLAFDRWAVMQPEPIP